MRRCKTKVPFADELAAKMALARRVWKDKGEVDYYRCPHCHKYHLTSQVEIRTVRIR